MQNIIMAAKENGWTLKILSVEQYDPHISSALNMLTEKQSAILQLAYRSGYFDRPRKITAEELARKVGLHKSTLLEHLRKAEKRVIGNVIEQSG
ncbi:MAG: helix-turn-helix domain-containing protein, partial [ANME-2 cluster archaeon]|nr:helix-turn-helix domain-containing protein [ANME-2 cluster archaeon]